MIDLVVIVTFSIVLGAIVGIIPGLTPLLGLMLAMPVIANYSVPEIILFWVCYLSVSQYYGSVGALLFKVPGETSSLPVLIFSEKLKLAKSVIRSYRLTAFSSFIASITGILFFLSLIYLLKDTWYLLFSIKFTLFFLSVIFFLLLINHKKYLFNFALIVAGLAISYMPDSEVAVNVCSQYAWSCFALNPVDFNLVVVCLYVIPFLFLDARHFSKRKVTTAKISWQSILKFRWLALKHALIGLVVGFTPGMGVTLSSNISARYEASKNEYQRLKVMAAAESANNSASITSTVPFIFIGLPITGTEVFLDNWIRVFKATNINYELLYNSFTLPLIGEVPFYQALAGVLLFVCTVCFVLTSGFIGFYQKLSNVPNTVFNWIVRFLILGITAISLSKALESGWTMPMLTLVTFSAFGIWCHRKGLDLIALPVTIVIGKYALDRFFTAYYLWS